MSKDVIKILCIGDIVGRPGREVLAKALPRLAAEHQFDLVIANGENSAGGSGIMPKQAKEIYAAGVDVITLGDHVWDKPEINVYLNETPNIIRPANFPEACLPDRQGAPGVGYVIAQTKSGVKVGVINLLGRTFMRYNVECPFRMLDKIVATIRKETPVIVLDMHAETTSEKVAIGHYSDGRVSCVFGTHTHVQTADDKILPKGTAYITDLGMSGPVDSVIGQNKEKIITRFLTSLPQKFEVADDQGLLQGIIVSIDPLTGLAQAIERVQAKE